MAMKTMMAMKRNSVFLWITLLLSLGFSGCANTLQFSAPQGSSNIYQIQLAIYNPVCVSVYQNSNITGAPLETNSCTPTNLSEQWTLKPMDTGNDSSTTQTATTGIFQIINVNSQMCMTVAAPDMSPGEEVLQAPCVADGGNHDQVWKITPAPTGQAGNQFIVTSGTQCLDDPYGATDGIFQMQQYYCTANDPAQGWILHEVPVETSTSTTNAK